jgi:hypothetical protein
VDLVKLAFAETLLPMTEKAPKTGSGALSPDFVTYRSARRLSNQILENYRRKRSRTLWCGHFSSSSLLKQLGDFGVELHLDTFFPRKYPKTHPFADQTAKMSSALRVAAARTTIPVRSVPVTC